MASFLITSGAIQRPPCEVRSARRRGTRITRQALSNVREQTVNMSRHLTTSSKHSPPRSLRTNRNKNGDCDKRTEGLSGYLSAASSKKSRGHNRQFTAETSPCFLVLASHCGKSLLGKWGRDRFWFSISKITLVLLFFAEVRLKLTGYAHKARAVCVTKIHAKMECNRFQTQPQLTWPYDTNFI